MPRLYPAGQAANAEFAFHSWLMLYNQAFNSVSPVLMGSGLMEQASTQGKNYHVPIPPLALGDTVTEIDGNEWPASFIQSAEVTGTTLKRGPKGLQMTEDDLLEDRIGMVNANVEAMGRSKRLFSDKLGAAALEAGLTATGHDNEIIFSTTHSRDPIAGAGTQSNSHSLALTPDNLLTVLQGFQTLVAENGDPIFAGGQMPEFTLIHPVGLKTDAEKVVDRMMITDAVGSVTNITYKRVKTVCLPQLTDASRWYVAVNNLARKPILRVVFKDMTDVKLGPESDLWKSKQLMKLYSYEKTHYRLVDWRLIATSKP